MGKVLINIYYPVGHYWGTIEADSMEEAKQHIQKEYLDYYQCNFTFCVLGEDQKTFDELFNEGEEEKV